MIFCYTDPAYSNHFVSRVSSCSSFFPGVYLHMSKRLFLMSSLLCLSAALPHNADAAGFYIQEQSVKGLGSAFAGSVTSLDDASVVYFNPAGMTKLDRAQVNGGVHMLVPSAKLSNNGSTFNAAPSGGGSGGNPYNPTPVPNGFAVMPLNSDQSLWAGIGVTAPFGLANDYGDSWFGRFDSTKTELTTINIQPSLAYKVNDWLSIGAGVDVQYAKANLEAVVSDTV